MYIIIIFILIIFLWNMFSTLRQMEETMGELFTDLRKILTKEQLEELHRNGFMI